MDRILTQKQETTVLRGHHLLCIFGWRGFGYDDEFIEAMDEIAKSLSESKSAIEIITGTDELCKRCPNLRGNRCFKNDKDQEESILEHDKRVLGFLGLTAGQNISANELKETIFGKEPYKSLRELCLGCSWIEEGYCFEGLEKLKVESDKQKINDILNSNL